MAKRRFQTKYDVAEKSRLLGDELDQESEMMPLLFWGDDSYTEEEDDYGDVSPSPFDFWEEQITQVRTLIWWIGSNIDQLIRKADVDVLSDLHDQVSYLLQDRERMIDNESGWNLERIEQMLLSALRLKGGFSNTMLADTYEEMGIELRLERLDELEPPIRRKLTSKKNELPDGAIEDPRDDRTSWKRGLIRTRFGTMSVKDARELDMAEHQFDKANQWAHFDHLPRIRVRKAWMVRDGRKRRTWSSPSARMTWQEMDFFLSEASLREDREELEAKASWLAPCCERIMPGMTPTEAIDYALDHQNDFGSPLYWGHDSYWDSEEEEIPEYISRCFSLREIKLSRRIYPKTSDLVNHLEWVMSQAM